MEPKRRMFDPWGARIRYLREFFEISTPSDLLLQVLFQWDSWRRKGEMNACYLRLLMEWLQEEADQIPDDGYGDPTVVTFWHRTLQSSKLDRTEMKHIKDVKEAILAVKGRIHAFLKHEQRGEAEIQDLVDLCHHLLDHERVREFSRYRPRYLAA